MAARIAVVLSGSGTTLENLFVHIDDGRLDAEVALVISSSPKAYGLERARRRNVKAVTIERRGFANAVEYGDAVFAEIRPAQVDLVVLAGFVKLLPIPDDFQWRVVNTHPALIPAFCGKGFYGRHVYEAVLARGAKVTGVTVHFCDNTYDHGPIIAQQAVEVFDDDTPETLAARVQQAERELYPRAIQWVLEGRVEVLDALRTRLLPARVH
jgi:formyltetrahydrofolate-dependent phosphoribosylglycinamide formyltransferase